MRKISKNVLAKSPISSNSWCSCKSELIWIKVNDKRALSDCLLGVNWVSFQGEFSLSSWLQAESSSAFHSSPKLTFLARSHLPFHSHLHPLRHRLSSALSILRLGPPVQSLKHLVFLDPSLGYGQNLKSLLKEGESVWKTYRGLESWDSGMWVYAKHWREPLTASASLSWGESTR